MRKKEELNVNVDRPFYMTTMSAKSLATLPVIYAVDELQPLPRTTMLFEGDMNSTGGRSGVFPNS